MGTYSLNVDQGTALRRLAAMFCDGTHSELSSILLIHGKHSHYQVNLWSLHGNVEQKSSYCYVQSNQLKPFEMFLFSFQVGGYLFGVWYMFNASLKTTGVNKYFFMDNPANVTMLFRNALSSQERMCGIM